MKRRFPLIPALLAFLVPLAAPAQSKSPEPRLDDAFRTLELHSKELALEDQKARLAFDVEMRKLALAERRMALNPTSPGPKGRFPKCPPFMASSVADGPRCPAFCPLGLLAVCAVLHLLLAWWVHDDIKRRRIGSRIWVVMALVTGLIGTFVYAVVRLGDRPA